MKSLAPRVSGAIGLLLVIVGVLLDPSVQSGILALLPSPTAGYVTKGFVLFGAIVAACSHSIISPTISAEKANP